MDLMTLLAIGFGLGLMHALDADHVLAISTLNAKAVSSAQVMRFCLHWSLGHGAILLLSGAFLFAIGYNLPVSVQHVAESAVGVLLIVMGLYLLWTMHKDKLVISQHKHGDMQHTHWHKTGDVDAQGHAIKGAEKTLEKTSKSNHAPMLVGVLHGLAGSAPALAIIPALAKGDTLLAMTYVLIFSIGVSLSMMFFGLSWGYLQSKLQKTQQHLFQIVRHLIGGLSIGLGCYWLLA